MRDLIRSCHPSNIHQCVDEFKNNPKMPKGRSADKSNKQCNCIMPERPISPVGVATNQCCAANQKKYSSWVDQCQLPSALVGAKTAGCGRGRARRVDHPLNRCFNAGEIFHSLEALFFFLRRSFLLVFRFFSFFFFSSSFASSSFKSFSIMRCCIDSNCSTRACCVSINFC